MKITIAASFLLPFVFGIDLHNLPDTFEFNDIPVGNAVINIGPDVQIRAFKSPLDNGIDKLVPAIPIIYDTENPDEDWRQWVIGSPHEDYGGPGTGKGGMRGSDYTNDKARGNCLVISSDEDIFNPVANLWGGVLSFKFKIPTNLDSIGLLMSYYSAEMEVLTDDGKSYRLKFAAKYGNSYWLMPLKIPNAVQLVYRYESASAITHLNFKAVEEKCPVSQVIDFSNYEKGAKLRYLPEGITVQAIKAGSEKIYPAMVLDTFDPYESDFGSPHSSIQGPGKGPDGRLGMPYENMKKLGNALIVSRDLKPRLPKSVRAGGKLIFIFDDYVHLTSIGLFNIVQGAQITVEARDDYDIFVNTYDTNVSGRNGFHEMFFWIPATKRLIIDFHGAGAVTFIKLGKC